MADEIVAASAMEGSCVLRLEGADHIFCVFTDDPLLLQLPPQEPIKWVTAPCNSG